MPQTKRVKLSDHERQVIGLLGLPSFGFSLAITVVVTYVPLVARQFTSSTTIVGLLIATEGLVALTLPIVAGTFSDHLRTRIGGRLPFVIAGLPLTALTLILIGFAGSLWQLIPLIVLFFIGYYLAYEPYRALYPDLVKDYAAGRAQSIQAVWRGVGTGLALTAGGFLFAATIWLPFEFAALLVVLSTLIFLWMLLSRHGVPAQRHHTFSSIRQAYVSIWELLRQPTIRNFAVMSALWELCLAALKAFILLYITAGLGRSKLTAATFIGITSVVMLIAAPIGGKLADTYGKVRVARLAAMVFGAGLLIPGLTSRPWLIVLVMPIGAFGGAIVLTLPYALLMPMMPVGEHGKLTGLYSTSRGIGIMLGPLVAGVAVSLGKHVLPAHGYSAMWLVCALAMLASVPFLSRLERPAANKVTYRKESHGWLHPD